MIKTAPGVMPWMPMNSSPNMALGAGMNYGPQNPNPGGLAGLLNQIPRGWQIPKGNTGVFAHPNQNMKLGAGMNYGPMGYGPQGPRQQGGMGALESVLNSYSPKMKIGTVS